MSQFVLGTDLANTSDLAKPTVTAQKAPTAKPSVTVPAPNSKESKSLHLPFSLAIANI